MREIGRAFLSEIEQYIKRFPRREKPLRGGKGSGKGPFA